MITFEANTADQLWQRVRNEFSTQDRTADQGSRCGSTRELLHVGLTVQDPQQHWTVTRSPAMNPAFAIAEVVWIVTGRDDSAFLNFWNPGLPKYAGAGDRYHGAYGQRLRHHFNIDQLERAYQALSGNSTSRQVVLQIWDPRVDLPSQDGQPVDLDIPCNLCSLLKVRDGRLEWLQLIRSNDFFLGVPHNFVQFMSLQEVVAGWLGVPVGTYNQVSDSLHLYEKDVLHVDASAPFDVPPSTDSLSLAKRESDEGFLELARRMDRMREPALQEQQLMGAVVQGGHGLPTALHNFLLIAAADSARRHGWMDASQRLASECGNPALRLMWSRWQDRKHGAIAGN